MLHFADVTFLCRSSLIFDMFPSVLVCNPDRFFLYRFMNFEQRYTTVVFIYVQVLSNKQSIGSGIKHSFPLASGDRKICLSSKNHISLGQSPREI